MADVQLENGYTKIANEILEEIAKIKLSPTQYRLLFVIWRFTYGFNRKQHKISLTFLSQATGCNPRQIQRELKRLEEKAVISQIIKSGSCRKITFNKNHTEWVGNRNIGETINGELDNKTYGGSNKGFIGEIDNKEINKKKLKEKDHKLIKSAPYLEYEKFFGTPSASLAQSFIDWIKKSEFQEPEEIICETINRAKLHHPDKPAAYIESILKKLHQLELYTLSAVKEYNAKFDYKYNSKTPPLNKMFDKTKRLNKALDKEELNEVKRMEEKFPF